jgi:hypothetical protein
MIPFHATREIPPGTYEASCDYWTSLWMNLTRRNACYALDATASLSHSEDLMRLIASLSAVVVLALFAVACGGSDDKKDGGLLSGNQSSTSNSQAGADTGKTGGAANNAALLDPCKLFLKEDATAALGQPVKDGELKQGASPLGQRMCFYGAADDKSPSSVQLSIVQTAGMTEQVRKSGQTAKVLHDNTKSSMTGATAVPGIGQDAFIATTSIYMLKGDAHLSILLFGNGRPGEATHTNALKAAATKVVARVP